MSTFSRIIECCTGMTFYANSNLAVILGFEHATYSTHEGNGSVEVCIQVKSGVLWSSLYLSLTTVDGNAVCEQCYNLELFMCLPSCSQ